VSRVADTVLKFAVVRQDHQPLGVIVESACRVNAGQVNEVGQGCARVMSGKLAHDLEGFIEENQLCHAKLSFMEEIRL